MILQLGDIRAWIGTRVLTDWLDLGLAKTGFLGMKITPKWSYKCIGSIYRCPQSLSRLLDVSTILITD